MAADLMQFYNDPSLAQAGNDAASAGNTASAYQSAASLLPAKLRQAVEEKVNYNKDIIDSKNKAQADYFAAPSAARDTYQNIFNPFTREKLVAQATSNAYAPYQSLTDILAQRTGALSDLINNGVGAFNSSVSAAGGVADNATKRYQQLLDLASTKSSSYAKQYDLNHPSGGAGDAALSGLASLIALMQGGDTSKTSQASGPTLTDPATGQIYQYDSLQDPAYIEDYSKGWTTTIGDKRTWRVDNTP